MNSPQFLKVATKRIINSCPNVGKVSFGEYRTDWIIVVGLLHDGSIRRFKYVSPDVSPSWGERICF